MSLWTLWPGDRRRLFVPWGGPRQVANKKERNRRGAVTNVTIKPQTVFINAQSFLLKAAAREIPWNIAQTAFSRACNGAFYKRKHAFNKTQNLFIKAAGGFIKSCLPRQERGGRAVVAVGARQTDPQAFEKLKIALVGVGVGCSLLIIVGCLVGCPVGYLVGCLVGCAVCTYIVGCSCWNCTLTCERKSGQKTQHVSGIPHPREKSL